MEHQKLDAETLKTTWTDFKLEGDLAARDALILHYMSLVRAQAAKIAAQLPKMIDREDLVSYGVFGLLDALEKFDLDRPVKFETYAVTRIRGSIFDEIRGLDWVPRTVRAKARDIERAHVELHALLGRPAQDSEVAEHLGITLVELWSTQTQTEAGQIDTLHDAADHEHSETGAWHSRSMQAFSDPVGNPEDLFGAIEVSELLAEAIEQLPQRSKTILVLYYLHEMTLAEIGEILGVTESRVCQLQSKLLQSLHEALSQGLVAAA